MIINKIFSTKSVLVCSFVTALCAFLLKTYDLNLLFNALKVYFSLDTTEEQLKGVYSLKTLAQYNGIDKPYYYLAILGLVFDVTDGRKHYMKGGYNYFIGKDGSRSFITGNFSDESDEKDHVVDLACEDLFNIVNWVDTYKSRYIYKGKLIGRYYNKEGKQTPYKTQLNHKMKQCREDKKMSDDIKLKYPPCNVEWSVGSGTRVWCSNNSGGIKRFWVGVPRKLFTPGETNPRCVCVDLQQDHSMARLKTYDECDAKSISCSIINDSYLKQGNKEQEKQF